MKSLNLNWEEVCVATGNSLIVLCSPLDCLL